MERRTYCFFPAESLGTIQACSSEKSSRPRRTRTRMEVCLSLKELCRIFWIPERPCLKGDLTQRDEPMVNSSTMSPVWSMSPVHSSARELPLIHSMERTMSLVLGDSEVGWIRSMGILRRRKIQNWWEMRMEKWKWKSFDRHGCVEKYEKQKPILLLLFLCVSESQYFELFVTKLKFQPISSKWLN